MKKKKYAIGGTAMNIKSPNEIAQNFALMSQQAKAEAAQGSAGDLRMASSMLSSLGSSMVTQGMGNISPDAKGVTGFLKNNQGLINSIQGMASAQYALGGTAGKASINAEGKEVIETPDGMVGEIQGPSHEQGGVDMDVPQGTDIYSKRLKGPDGKTMAERKKRREKSISALEKLLDSNPSDKLIKKTLKRIKENNEQVDTQDVNTMNLYRSIEEATKKYAGGGTVYGSGYQSKFEPLLQKYSEHNPDFDVNDLDQRKALQTTLGVGSDGVFGKNTYNALSNYSYDTGAKGLGVNTEDLFKYDYTNGQGEQVVGDNTYSPSLANTTISPQADSESASGEGGILNNILGGATAGDLLGMVSQYKASKAGLDAVNANRAGDTANVNSFKNYGVEGLEALNGSKKYIDSQRNNALMALEDSKAGAMRQNRNSARGVNTQRALNLATSRNADKGSNDVYNNFSEKMMEIMFQQANMENSQDQVVMQGEKERDLADRQDRDNYYSQLSQATADKYTGMQHIGKNMNAVKSNNVSQNLIDQLSKYGLQLDEQGNLITG